MDGKVVIVTGATDGIGRATAADSAATAALPAVRALSPWDGTRKKARRRSPSYAQARATMTVTFLPADLSRQGDVRSLAAMIAERHDRLDVLVNNAGGLFATRKVSADGIEMTLALNHLAYFLLTNLLLEQLQATPGARIVNVASAAHAGEALDFDDLQLTRRYNGWTAYRRSKLCNLLFTYELPELAGGSARRARP